MLLSDRELRELIESRVIEVTDGADVPWDVDDVRIYDPDSSEAAVQAASIDLGVGDIYLPTGTGKRAKADLVPLSTTVLEPGRTAVIKTTERLKMPQDVGGILMPQNTIAANGLLLLNPGHVDPGFKGRLEFTVINMGHDAISLHQGIKIATMLFLRLQRPCIGSWARRNLAGQQPAAVDFPDEAVANATRSLSVDFLDVQKRAKAEARRQVHAATWVVTGLVVVLTALVTVGGVIATNMFQAKLTNSKTVDDLRQQVAVMKQKVDDMDHQGAIPGTPSSAPSSTPGRR
ncbi:dCTP deaminase [Streptomyces sp. NPDC002078]